MIPNYEGGILKTNFSDSELKLFPDILGNHIFKFSSL